MSVTFREVTSESSNRPPAEVPEFRVAKMTVPEYLSLVDEGFFGVRRVELWEGWVIDRMTHGSLSATIISKLTRWFSSKLPQSIAFRCQLPVRLATSCPEPDLAVVRGQEADYLQRHPGSPEVLLLIEVSDSTLDDDRTIKGRMYAGAGITEYWIVNCEEHQIEVYTEPQTAAQSPIYQQRTIYTTGQSVAVRIGSEHIGEIAVSELFR